MKSLVRAILDQYTLPLDGHHGVTHWARVLENGRRLTATTGADLKVVSLFAIFHDACRDNEGTDPDHGLRGAELAKTLRGDLFVLDDEPFDLLYRACAGHTHVRTDPDITVQTCWDSDRLDLGRVGITPLADRLCTRVAKAKETIDWADGRARFRLVPDLVRHEWALDIELG